MENTSLNKYLEDRNINVIWNTLGRNEELISAYIADTHHLVNASHSKKSHHLKQACYAQFYEIADRKKKTGFENFEDQAVKIKTELCSSIAQGGTPCIFVDTPKPVDGGYKETLKNSFRDISGEKFLYFSGGADSEMVANALVDAGIPFTPVIFNWTDRSGHLQNSYETDFAYAFCEKHNLTPIVRTIDIERLWESEEFKQLAFDVQLISAHLVTYVYIVDLIAKEFPGKTHLFGGEVRYVSSTPQEDGSLSNIVLLAKTTPGYNGGTNAVQNTLSANARVQLAMSTTGYTFTVSRTLGNTGPTGTLSGTWHNGVSPDPSGYSYSITSVTDVGSGGASPNPTGATGYTALTTGSTVICAVAASGDNGAYTFGIRVKSNTSGTFMNSTITLSASGI